MSIEVWTIGHMKTTSMNGKTVRVISTPPSGRNANIATALQHNGSAYVVPTGKKFVVCALQANEGGQWSATMVAYLYTGTSAGATTTQIMQIPPGALQGMRDIPWCGAEFPAGTYFTEYSGPSGYSTALGLVIIGYEVAA